MWYALQLNEQGEIKESICYLNAPPIFSLERQKEGWRECSQEEFIEANLCLQARTQEKLNKINLDDEPQIVKTTQEKLYIVAEEESNANSII